MQVTRGKVLNARNGRSKKWCKKMKIILLGNGAGDERKSLKCT